MLGLCLAVPSMVETATSRICREVAKCTSLCTSKVQSSALETCISLVSLSSPLVSLLLTSRVEGDGEISFCGAIEMPGVITIKFTVMKDGIAQLGMKSPIYVPGAVEPQFGPGRYIYFEGFSVDEHGKQHYMDTSVAYRQTSLRAIEYLRRYGYDDYQSYLLLGCAPVQGHVAGIVDIPNACTTMGLPMDIFDFEINPSKPAVKQDMGKCAFANDNPGASA